MRSWSTLLALLFVLLAAAPSRAAATSGRGAIVVATDAAARPAAKALARAVYQDATLRPTMHEAVARALVGEPTPNAENKLKLAEIASVIKVVEQSKDAAIRKRLLASIGQDLKAELLILVEHGASGSSARVMRVAEQRFLSVVLAPKVDTSKPTAGTPGATQASPPPTNDWSDALAILRGLARGASPPGPRIAGSDSSSHGHSGKAGKPGKADPLAKPDDGKSDSNFLTSPWFWGGLGVVLSVGVTVLVLSQTALNEPDVVVLEGHVSP